MAIQGIEQIMKVVLNFAPFLDRFLTLVSSTPLYFFPCLWEVEERKREKKEKVANGVRAESLLFFFLLLGLHALQDAY